VKYELREWFTKHSEFAAMAGCLILFLVFSITAPTFLTLDSIGNILTVASELGLMAIGMTILIISGEIDLSVSAVLGVSAMIFGFAGNAGWPMSLSLFVSIIVALLIGMINGMVTIMFKIPSFISTLGMMMFWRGILLAATGGFPIYFWSDDFIFHVLAGRLFISFRTSVIIWLVLAFVLNLLLKRSRFGNAVYATGGNKETARLLGIKTDKVKLINFMIISVLAGLVGCMQFARFKSADPMQGFGIELEVIAATVIGGTLFSGGAGSVVGTMFGVLLMGMVRSGLIQSGAPTYWYQAFIGLIVVTAVVVNTKIRRWILE
jgi:simple sugar transport system permease protein